ncbi:MAG: AAA family ATPase, partial [Actinobacteria bacterium]|nr:AAA family ATPase [Actinomycetota bacterium]
MIANIETVVMGKSDIVRLALVAIVCEGHILFEDVPGTGKTVLARAISQSIQATDNRIQCTPDMLPGDITGSSIYDQKKGTFEFMKGPVFCNILLADEINRASPKTQSALLEAMGERRVTG